MILPEIPTEAANKLQELIKYVEEDTTSNGIIHPNYINYLEKNFPKEFISLVLNGVGLIKLKKQEFGAAEFIFERAIKDWDKEKENPYLYTSLAFTQLMSIEPDSKLNKINIDKVIAAKENLDLAKKCIEKKPNSYYSTDYERIIEKYLSYFKFSWGQIFTEIKYDKPRQNNPTEFEEHINRTIKEKLSSRKPQMNINVFGNVTQSQLGNNNTLFNFKNLSIEEQKDLAEAAAEIQKLLEQLAGDNQTTNEKVEVLHQKIKGNPNLNSRLKSALKAGGLEAIKAIFNHPLFNIPAETIKGWLEAE